MIYTEFDYRRLPTAPRPVSDRRTKSSGPKSAASARRSTPLTPSEARRQSAIAWLAALEVLG